MDDTPGPQIQIGDVIAYLKEHHPKVLKEALTAVTDRELAFAQLMDEKDPPKPKPQSRARAAPTKRTNKK